eukprot:1954419-Pyramimonas_sp.AAC.1
MWAIISTLVASLAQWLSSTGVAAIEVCQTPPKTKELYYTWSGIRRGITITDLWHSIFHSDRGAMVNEVVQDHAPPSSS